MILYVLVALLVLALVGGWWIDRSVGKRGYKVTGVRHTGLRREITYERIDDDGRPHRPDAERHD
jgi:hypothetical protein